MAGIVSEIRLGRNRAGCKYFVSVKCFRKMGVEAELALGLTQATRLLLPNVIPCNTPILLIASTTGLLQVKGGFRTLLALKDLLLILLSFPNLELGRFTSKTPYKLSTKKLV
jgi:hypothetical protein